MLPRLVAEDRFQFPRGWLKAEAFLNMLPKSVTEETSHPLRSSLKLLRFSKADLMSVTSETFQSRGIGIDRAARAGLSCVEDILGKRLWPLEEGWRY